ncbi:DUF2860 domain-containing protein [Vibrio europaeus]|uniref:DUF2860 domain-containing protein n=1 Tax=Vibrio europaeus TaxID=300876 RepID=UPI0039E13169
MNYRVLLPLGILLSSNAFAELDERGLGGEISLLMGYGSETSNSQDTKRGKLNSAGEKESGAAFVPLGQLRYTFGQDNTQQVFIGTSRGDIIEGVFALEIGYALEYGDESTISFSYLPTIASGEVWEDPFIVNTPRRKTDISGDTFRIQVEDFLNLPISGDFAYYQQDVKNEKSGTFLSVSMNELRRDAKGYYASLSTGLPISSTSFLEPSFSYQRHLADGKAVSFSRYSGSLTYMMLVDKHAFSISSDYSISQYDVNNPVFNKIRKDRIFSFNLGYEYKGLPGWEDWGFNALAGYSNNSSSITFYDTNGYFVGVGLSYHF